MNQENLFDIESDKKPSGPVECLGVIFESDEARRAHFTDLLRKKLKDPEFRALEGFPIGTDEAILELSDPPYYTACPNPWLSDFVKLWESQKVTSDAAYLYHREPYTADVSEGKNDPIYNAHSYHTKVPHKAVMRYILHYTEPGDSVLDGFCGTGMTGVAANLCGDRSAVESLGYFVDESGDIYEVDEYKNPTNKISKLGQRNVIVNDLSPAATFIASNYNSPLEADSYELEVENILGELEDELSWMYKTKHDDGSDGVINYTIWSDVFECPECSEEVVFWDNALDHTKGQVKNDFNCPKCHSVLNKKNMVRVYEQVFDELQGAVIKTAKQKPVLINYSVDNKRFTKIPDTNDLEVIDKSFKLEPLYPVPTDELQDGVNTRQPKNSHGMSHIHHFYTKRNLYALSRWLEFSNNSPQKNKLKFVFTSAHQYLNRLCRLHVGNHFSKKGGTVDKPLERTLYMPSISLEVNVISRIKLRARLRKSLLVSKPSVVTTGSAARLAIPDNSIDYMFYDPPFGANINYSEVNALWEGWLKVKTNTIDEAIVNETQKKQLDDYRVLMKAAFANAYRVLKPGRWLTVEFSNTKAAVWNSIQSALTEAGFVVSSVSALDKKKGSHKAMTSPTAVKQDLVITAYKPLEGFAHDKASKHVENVSVWEFIGNHLRFLSAVRVKDNEIVFVPERDPRILFDQVVTFYIQRGHEVPISSLDFQTGLAQKFYERDGMYFTAEQVADYDRKRAVVSRVQQISIFVDDESSAIEWMRQELKDKPKTYSEIHPLFLNELSGWKKNELELELSTLLEQNFLKYDGKDDVPSQIHTYLSTNFKDMRGLDKSDPKLVAKAKDRWYVPDPNKAADLEKVRLRALLKEFETYKAEKKKIKQPRAEALRAGFNTAWEAQDFQTILDISAKIPPAVLQEDEKLLMFYDNALTLTSTEDDEW